MLVLIGRVVCCIKNIEKKCAQSLRSGEKVYLSTVLEFDEHVCRNCVFALLKLRKR